jgi:hypothetical protein
MLPTSHSDRIRIPLLPIRYGGSEIEKQDAVYPEDAGAPIELPRSALS